MKGMKPEMTEGPEAFEQFKKAMKHVISVPHAVIQEKIEAHRREAEKNPNRPGPKRKKK
jgi:hypothetical protein